jgi:hypothetical protein
MPPAANRTRASAAGRRPVTDLRAVELSAPQRLEPAPEPAPSSGDTIKIEPSGAGPEVKAGPVTAPVIPVLLIALGGYLAWFGVHYWRQDVRWPSDPIKAVLQGKGLPGTQPTPAVASYLTTETQQYEQRSAATAERAAGSAAPSGPGETAWIEAMLTAVASPPTPANIRSITAWIAHEGPWGTQAQNNPLNTTLVMPGSTSFAGTPAQNYPTAAEGIAATAQTLHSGPYGDILLWLRSGKGLCGKQLRGLATWSGGGYNQVC